MRKLPPEPVTPSTYMEIASVVKDAMKGDTKVLPKLQNLLDEHPSIWREHGDIGRHSMKAWIEATAGPDLHLRECLLRQLDELQAQLGGVSQSPIEDLLAERVAICWLQVHFFDLMEAKALNKEEHMRMAMFRAHRQEQAHRRYMSALASLAAHRRLMPTSGVPSILQSLALNGNGTNDHHNGHHRNGKVPVNRITAIDGERKKPACRKRRCGAPCAQ